MSESKTMAASEWEDAVRIVPLSLPRELTQPTIDAAVAVEAPNLTYRGGPLLTAVEVVALYWGHAWASSQASLVQHLNACFDFILSSDLLDRLGEYGVSGKPIEHGRRTASVAVPAPDPPVNVRDAEIRAFLQKQLASNPAIPKAGPNSLHFIFLPPGVRVTQRGTRSCQSFCGYHDAIGSTLFYAVMPYPGCPGCRGGLSVVDALTTTMSHELSEAITDPIPGRGWYDDAHGEIGDICAWKTRKLGGYTIQMEWSNSAGSCV